MCVSMCVFVHVLCMHGVCVVLCVWCVYVVCMWCVCMVCVCGVVCVYVCMCMCVCVCVCVCGVVWCGVVWCGVVWCGVVWCGVWCLSARIHIYIKPYIAFDTWLYCHF